MHAAPVITLGMHFSLVKLIIIYKSTLKWLLFIVYLVSGCIILWLSFLIHRDELCKNKQLISVCHMHGEENGSTKLLYNFLHNS